MALILLYTVHFSCILYFQRGVGGSWGEEGGEGSRTSSIKEHIDFSIMGWKNLKWRREIAAKRIWLDGKYICLPRGEGLQSGTKTSNSSNKKIKK
jgi:hypothetical protein